MSGRAKRTVEWLALVLVIVVVLTACGCVEFLGADDGTENGVQVTTTPLKSPSGSSTTPKATPPAEIPPGMDEELWWELYGDQPLVTVAITPPPDMESYVVSAEPIVDEETVPSGLVSQGMPANDGSSLPFAYPIYQGYYFMRYDNAGLAASIAEAPLVIDYKVNALNDNPYYAFLVITVRDADTLEVVAQEGYGRVYSVQEEKQIIIRAPGNYHINLYGNLVDVDLTVSAGG
jgi:hypothetical protein